MALKNISGANIVIPDLPPVGVRKYGLYGNKICMSEESAKCVVCLSNRMKSAGYKSYQAW